MVVSVFLGVIGVLYPTPAWKVFFEARKVPKRFSNGGGRVRVFLLC